MTIHASPRFQGSSHCKASPDGKLIASLSAHHLSSRDTDTLETSPPISIPEKVAKSVAFFHWSASSTRILIGNQEELHVYSLADPSFHAHIHNPVSGAGRISAVLFGHTHDQVIVFSAFGIKLVIFNLASSTGIELHNPKFYQPAAVPRGFCIRPHTGHLAILTRSGGRDVISLHHSSTKQVLKSWTLDLIDTQGISWTPDGRWLLAWESAAHGHRLLLFSPEGQLFRSLDSSALVGDLEPELNTGIRLYQPSPDAQLCALADYSKSISVLRTTTWTETVRLIHPSTISPKTTLQIWQEEISQSSTTNTHHRTFTCATRSISPEASSTNSKTSADGLTGCSRVAFDASSTLLATRYDESPHVIWIWDLQAAELRAVLVFHSHVSFTWHPKAPEWLLITCVDDAHQDVCYAWDPLSAGPTVINMQQYLQSAATSKKLTSSWINSETPDGPPRLLLSSSMHYTMIALQETTEGENPWADKGRNSSSWLLGSEHRSIAGTDSQTMSDLMDDQSLVDDTFSFKNP